MLAYKKLKPIKNTTNANMTLDEILPKGLQENPFAGLDDDEILMQNVIGGGIDNKTKKSTVEALLVDD